VGQQATVQWEVAKTALQTKAGLAPATNMLHLHPACGTSSNQHGLDQLTLAVLSLLPQIRYVSVLMVNLGAAVLFRWCLTPTYPVHVINLLITCWVYLLYTLYKVCQV
jgi:hypothetical protein